MAVSYCPPVPGFYWLYLKITLLLIASLAIFEGVKALLGEGKLITGGFMGPLIFTALAWVMIWPTLAARMQELVWSHTRLGPLHFSTEMRAGRL